VDLSSVGNITSRVYLDSVTHTASQIPSDHLVCPDLLVLLFGVLRQQGNAHSLLALLTLEQDAISLEDFELIHLSLRQLYC